jgi:hypothetical protein
MDPVVVSAFAEMVRRDASEYPFYRNSSFAHARIFSETPSIGFVTFSSQIYNSVI